MQRDGAPRTRDRDPARGGDALQRGSGRLWPTRARPRPSGGVAPRVKRLRNWLAYEGMDQLAGDFDAFGSMKSIESDFEGYLLRIELDVASILYLDAGGGDQIRADIVLPGREGGRTSAADGDLTVSEYDIGAAIVGEGAGYRSRIGLWGTIGGDGEPKDGGDRSEGCEDAIPVHADFYSDGAEGWAGWVSSCLTNRSRRSSQGILAR